MTNILNYGYILFLNLDKFWACAVYEGVVAHHKKSVYSRKVCEVIIEGLFPVNLKLPKKRMKEENAKEKGNVCTIISLEKKERVY